MGIYQFANNAASTLGSAISPTSATITLATGTGAEFPNPAAGQYFTATLFASGSSTGLPNEIIRCTARVGDTLTVVRGQEGTTAQSWNVGDTFANFLTAGFLNKLVDSTALQGQGGNYAADQGNANAATVTLVPAPVSLAAMIGAPVRVKKVGVTNTGAYTLNVNALGVVPVLLGGIQLEGGELVGSEIFEVAFDGASFNLLSGPAVLHGDRLVGNSVLNAALAQMGALTLKGNLSGGAATPYDVPLSTVASMLGIGVIQSNANGSWFTIGSTIVQFGYKAATNGTFLFPEPFPSSCLGIYSSNANAMGRYTDPSYAYPVSAAQFFLATKASDDGHTSAFPCYWLAVGE